MKTLVANADYPVTWPEVEAFIRHYYKQALEHDPHYRVGQAYFNGLCEIYPDVAELVRGTNDDPFYANDLKDERMTNFFEFVIPFFQ